MSTGPKQNRVLLVDGYNTFIRSWLVIPVTNEDGEHFGGVFGFLQSLKYAVLKFNPTEVLVAWDGPQSGLRRKELLPAYKANRKSDWKPGSCRAFDFMSEREQNDNFGFQRNRVQEYLDKLPIKTIRIPYVEADDVMAEYARLVANGCGESIIYSSDADFKQLISDNIVCYNPISKKLTSRSSFQEDFGYPVENFIFMKTFMGDKSDNIAGIRGIGEKTLLKMFPQLFELTQVTLADLIEEAEHIVQSGVKGYTQARLKMYDKVSTSAKQLNVNFAIMQLADVDISPQALTLIRALAIEHPNIFDRFGMRKMFLTDKLGGSIKNFDSWTSTFSGLQTRRSV